MGSVGDVRRHCLNQLLVRVSNSRARSDSALLQILLVVGTRRPNCISMLSVQIVCFASDGLDRTLIRIVALLRFGDDLDVVIWSLHHGRSIASRLIIIPTLDELTPPGLF